MRSIVIALVMAASLPLCAVAQPSVPNNAKDLVLLMDAIKKYSDTLNARVGVAILGVERGEKVTVNGNLPLPMQSVYKLPLAICILDKVDKGLLKLDQQVHMARADLDSATWSPMMKDYALGDIDLSLKELLMYSISKSDNNACDVLFGLAGGTGAVNEYVHSKGIKEIAIAATEREMKRNWQVQYTNWCQAETMSKLLRDLYRNKLVSVASTTLLVELMTKSENSAMRLKGELPEGTVVAHKTGTSNTNARGITAATNDVGIVTMPSGRHYAIAVFVSDFKGGTFRGEYIIADISKMVWDVMTADGGRH